LVLNVASNLLKHYGKDDVDIEVVAFGPGLRLMMDGNVNTQRMNTLMAEGVRFSACKNTIVNFGKKLGKRPKLIEGVTVVPAGAARILQLNAAGYQTLKP
jgi:intracellular sulfur oxidation DsrE/DsrF family protein